jgi:hypothetical protein
MSPRRVSASGLNAGRPVRARSAQAIRSPIQNPFGWNSGFDDEVEAQSAQAFAIASSNMQVRYLALSTLS